MTYTVGIPLDGQSLGNSKPQVRANFSVLFNYTAVNHVALNAMGAGKHAFVEMPNQPIGATPIPTTVADECAIYSKALGPTPFANMVWQQESGGADPLRNQGAIVQMTGIRPTNAAAGTAFLPGGLLMIWGTAFSATAASAPVTRTVTYSVGGEGFTLAGAAAIPWIVLATPSTPAILAGQSWSVNNYTTTSGGQFDLKTLLWATNTPFNYLLIGPKT